MTKVQLAERLHEAGQPVATLAMAGDAVLQVIPAAGRVIGLYPGGEEINAFWTNPRLRDEPRAVFAPGCSNPGGDRTWLSPELDLMIGDPADPEGTYRVPPALDPGRYTVSAAVDAIVISGRIEIHFRRAKETACVWLRKRITLAADPLAVCRNLAFAGYRTETYLAWDRQPPSTARLGLWRLLQLPNGGEMLLKTRERAEPRTYFGDPGGRAPLAMDQCLRVACEGTVRHKFGVKAHALSGLAGYLRETDGGRWLLVVRQFAADPAGTYIDTPWDDPADEGYAFQCYRDPGPGSFCELEYHTPAIGPGPLPASSTDNSIVWAYLGDRKAVEEAAGMMLGSWVVKKEE